MEGVMARANNLILDRYEPIGTAGVGGFGTVQIAWDPRIQRKVAIKTIKLTELDAYRAYLPGAQAVSTSPTADRWHGVQPWDEYLQDEQDAAVEFGGYPAAHLEFDEPDPVRSLSHLPGLDEARTAAMLQDPRIVTVYDFEVRDRMAYLIMEYVEGITLTQLLADYSSYLSIDMVTSVFDSVAGALTVAHKAGVLHLDIKPDNIIINAQGQAKVTDFGLATLADASGVGTTGGGTIGYMPLEQMRREHLDVRTDEWSLAAVAYEMLTGDNPFRVSGLEQAEAAIEEAELVLPSLCWNGLDNQIDDVMFYALDPDREERYASVADFAEEMDKFLGDAAKGQEQLSLVVADALGLDEESGQPIQEWDDETAEEPQRPGLFTRLFEKMGNEAEDGFDDGNMQASDRPSLARGRQETVDETPARRQPLVKRFEGIVSNILARVFATLGSGFVTWVALANLPFIPAAFNAGTAFVVTVGAAIVAAIAAIVPFVASLVALEIMGLAIVACGHPLVGLLLMVVTAAWWVVVGREGAAPSNVALSLPLLGSIGGSSAAPFLSGISLRLPVALLTTVLVAVEALVFGSLGSSSLLGWDVLSNWDFGRTDITRNLVVLVKRASTWATIGGWLSATLVLALVRMRDSRLLTVVGLAVALVLMLVGSLAFADPTPQLIVTVILAVAALIAAFV